MWTRPQRRGEGLGEGRGAEGQAEGRMRGCEVRRGPGAGLVGCAGFGRLRLGLVVKGLQESGSVGVLNEGTR